MNKLSLFFLFVLLATFLNAAVYKGQRVFVKECLTCHKDGLELLASKDMKAWGALMDKQGSELAEVHLKDIRAEDSWSYFSGALYIKKSKHLRQFLVEYARDSGNIPTLD